MASTKAKVKSVPRATAYAQLIALADLVSFGLTSNVGSFPSPSPTTIVLNADNLTLQNAYTAWGTVGNRGTHAQLLALRAAALVVQTDLRQLAAYVQNLIDPTTPYADQVAFIALSGFSAKNSPSPQGVLGAVVNLHQMFVQTVPINQVKLKWKKPLGLLSPGNVKSYTIWRQPILPVPSAPVLVGTVTKTSFIDKTPPASSELSYIVYPNNTDGQGTGSFLTVFTP